MSRRPKAEDPTNSDPPLCADDCTWRQKYTGFALQRNALRSELASMIEPFRCGWNLKPGLIGGQPLDYAPCTHHKILRMDQMKQPLKVKCNVCGKKHRRKSFCRRCDEIDCPCGYCPKRLGKCSACGGSMSEA